MPKAPQALHNVALQQIPADKKLRLHVEAWLDGLIHRKSFSKHTLTAYSIDIRNFLGFINRHKGGEVTSVMLSELALGDFRSWLAVRHRETFPRLRPHAPFLPCVDFSAI